LAQLSRLRKIHKEEGAMKTWTGQLHGSMARMLLAVALVVALAAGMVQPAIAGTQIDIAGPPGSGYFGQLVTVLPNGNIVVVDPYYDAGPIADVGAVYLYDGATGVLISMLTGSTAGDMVGCAGSDCEHGVTVLSNGNYLVRTPYWDNGAAADAGAVTWGSGTTGVRGVVSAANSLVGSTAGDQVGWVGLLDSGNYLLISSYWDNSAAADAGAVTWGNGSTGTAGVVSAANSLVGSTAYDHVGYDGVTALSNGNYVVCSPDWSDGWTGTHWAGAVTWGDRTGGTIGPIVADNSVLGTAANGGQSMVWAYDAVNRQLVVGRPADNIVTLFRLPPVYPAFLPVMLKNAP
jgi:hypothetical protein